MSSRYLVIGRVVLYPFGNRLVDSGLVFHLMKFGFEPIHYFSRCCDVLPADVYMFAQRWERHFLVGL